MTVYGFTDIQTTANRASGVADFFYWAAVSEFATNGIQCPPSPMDATTNAALVTISTDHVFQLDKGFHRINGSTGKNNLEANITGEAGSLKFMKTVKVFIPGSDAELHSQISQMLNQPMIVLIKDSNCASNVWYQLGCDCEWAFIEPQGGFKTGTNKDGVKGYELTISCPGSAVVLYAGAITFPA